MDDKHMQIGEVATRTELSLRTIRHYEEAGLVIPSARSQGGFRLYTETDVARLMVIRRMKPLGFTLEQMRDLLDATDRLDGDDALDSGEREALLERVRTYQQAAAEQVEKLRVQLSRAEDFATTLSARLERDTSPARVHASVGQEDEPHQVAETEGARAGFAAGERFA
ncbi:MerR family transcriptional regulator [Streptomyces mutabilis]|uniref:MerR family transcriptional regulator n=1 Tax=Streptomyces mutabilis TaxID=67332 RepID=UPI0022BA53B1|nr:MerR family transcriptional regulator [Streptomyces mutabilis]MCZ9355387.1 MerR family transcriptional regulator [Streptomyces mutabilis]